MANTFDYVECDEEQIDNMNVLRKDFEHMLSQIEQYCPDSREKSLAKTKLEECALWANKSISHVGF